LEKFWTWPTASFQRDIRKFVKCLKKVEPIGLSNRKAGSRLVGSIVEGCAKVMDLVVIS
jgi:hypothetical protein